MNLQNVKLRNIKKLKEELKKLSFLKVYDGGADGCLISLATSSKLQRTCGDDRIFELWRDKSRHQWVAINLLYLLNLKKISQLKQVVDILYNFAPQEKQNDL